MRSAPFAALLLPLALLPLPLQAQPSEDEIHAEHWIHGVPRGAPASNDLVIRDIYALSSNDARKLADWVAYRLTVHDVDGPDLERDWAEDPWLEPDETLEEDDYEHAHDALGTNRGHLAPLASFRGTGEGDQANYLSNVTPQKAALNQGPWEELENAVRAVAREDTVWVLTGPLYGEEMPRLPSAEEDHRVPSAYWKVVAVEAGEEEDAPRVAAFVLDQEDGHEVAYCDRGASVETVEERSGLDLFWKLADGPEEELEASPGSARLRERLGC